MLRLLLDNIWISLADTLMGNSGVPFGTVIIVIGAVIFGVYALINQARLDEARRRPTTTTINVLPSMTGLYVIIGILILILIFGR